MFPIIKQTILRQRNNRHLIALKNLIKITKTLPEKEKDNNRISKHIARLLQNKSKQTSKTQKRKNITSIENITSLVVWIRCTIIKNSYNQKAKTKSI